MFPCLASLHVLFSFSFSSLFSFVIHITLFANLLSYTRTENTFIKITINKPPGRTSFFTMSLPFPFSAHGKQRTTGLDNQRGGRVIFHVSKGRKLKHIIHFIIPRHFHKIVHPFRHIMKKSKLWYQKYCLQGIYLSYPTKCSTKGCKPKWIISNFIQSHIKHSPLHSAKEKIHTKPFVCFCTKL